MRNLFLKATVKLERCFKKKKTSEGNNLGTILRNSKEIQS